MQRSSDKFMPAPNTSIIKPSVQDATQTRTLQAFCAAQLSPIHARLSRAVSHARRSPSLSALFSGECDVQDLRVSLTDPANFMSSWKEPAVIELSLQCADTSSPVMVKVALDLCDHLLVGLIATPEEDDNTEHPGALRTALLDLLLDPIMGMLHGLGVKESSVLGLTSAVTLPNDADSAALAVTCSFEEKNYELLLQVKNDFCDLLESFSTHGDSSQDMHAYQVSHLQATASLRNTLQSSSLGFIKLPGAIIVGGKQLTSGVLHRLKPGDVVLNALKPHAYLLFHEQFLGTLAHESRTIEPVQFVVTWGNPRYARLGSKVTVNLHSMTLSENLRMSHDFDESNTDLSTDFQSENSLQLDDLELPVQLELQTVSLSLDQLSSLEAGYVIELPQRVTNVKIRLVAHGQTIGYGEPVAVGDQLGLRITQMAHHNDPN